MSKKIVLIALLSFVVLMSALQSARAATITSATSDSDVYVAGQTGYLSVTVYNDKNSNIRVTDLTATINYYYLDGTLYMQKFFTGETLPSEIAAGDSHSYQIPISLPTNIAHGYTNPYIEARTEIWMPQTSRWVGSDWATYDQVKLYIESPYKQMYETSQQQVQEQQAVNQNLSDTINMLAITTAVFAVVAGFLMFLTFARRPRPVPQA
jgi:hypothetical protein